MSAVGILADVVAGRSQYALVHANCLDPWRGLACLPDRSAHVCLTDPPYEAEAHTLQRRKKGLTLADGDREVLEAPLDFDPITPEQRSALAAHAARACSQRALAFCQAEAIAAWKAEFNETEMPYRRSIPWSKPDAMPSLHGRWPGQSYEAIVLAQHPSSRPCPCGGGAKSYRVCKSIRGESPHPTTKPLALMLELVADFTDPGDIVIDPFMGSGTTGVACLRLGRRFIGWEMSADYYEIACRRLRGDEAKPRKEQPGLFDAVPTEAA